MRADQGRQMQETMAAREDREQKIVEEAKARAKAFAEKLKEEAATEASGQKAKEEDLRKKVSVCSKLGERETDMKDAHDESTEVASAVTIVDDEDDGLPALKERKKRSRKEKGTEAKS